GSRIRDFNGEKRSRFRGHDGFDPAFPSAFCRVRTIRNRQLRLATGQRLVSSDPRDLVSETLGLGRTPHLREFRKLRRMQNTGQYFEAVDNPWSGTREVRARIYQINLAGTGRR